MTEIELPPPKFWVAAPPRGGLALTETPPSGWGGAYAMYTAAQLQDYARAAVLAERDRCARLCEELMPKNERSDWTQYAEDRAEAFGDAVAAIMKGSAE